MTVTDRLAAGSEVLIGSARTQWAEVRTSPLVYVVGIVQPAVFLLVALLPQQDPSAAEGTRVAVGALLTAFWGSTVWSAAGILRRERFQGTLARLLSSARDPRLVLLGKSLGSSLVTVGLVTATVVAVLAALRQPVEVGGVPWLVVGLLVVLVSGASVGMLIGGLFVLTRYGPQLSSALMYPVYLVGGMLIPITFVPEKLRWLSWGLSLRWLQDYLVATATSSPDFVALLLAAALTLGYAVAGISLFDRVVDVSRRRGTLDLY